MRTFIESILKEQYKDNYDYIYNNSPLLKYLDMKTGAIDGDSKTRRNLANIYAIYSILFYYEQDFFNQRKKYEMFNGFDYGSLYKFCRLQYGGSKIQNHALNNRLNSEFIGKTHSNKEILIINKNKYLIHPDYIYVDKNDISRVVIKIIETYIQLLKAKDFKLSSDLEDLLSTNDYNSKKFKIESILDEKSEARIFEIISYAILKNHYNNKFIYLGTSKFNVKKVCLELYKTGRTNANDGGIDFVMKPLGRFFQVTEVNNYDKYLLDIDKVMHFPITFVIKTTTSKENIEKEINKYIDDKTGGMKILKQRYTNAIEEIITINELKSWIYDLPNKSIDSLISDIDLYFKLEMNMDDNNDIEISEDD